MLKRTYETLLVLFDNKNTIQGTLKTILVKLIQFDKKNDFSIIYHTKFEMPISKESIIKHTYTHEQMQTYAHTHTHVCVCVVGCLVRWVLWHMSIRR